MWPLTRAATVDGRKVDADGETCTTGEPGVAVRPEPESSGHVEVRRLSRCGTVKLEGCLRFPSPTLAGETVASEEVADGVRALHYYMFELGRFDERVNELKT